MNYKRWVVGFGILIIAVFLFIGMVNYTVDPFGYFAFAGGDYETLSPIQKDNENYTRLFKAEHVKKYSDQYDAYIVGGSKVGSYRTEKIQELDGYRYYNMFASAGSFQEYYLNTKFLVENTNAKKIVLNISGSEVVRFSSEGLGDMYKIPALVKGESTTLEYIDFLLKDVTISFDKIKERKENGNMPGYTFDETGARVLTKYYESMEKNPKAYIKKRVTKKLAMRLENLFTKEVENKAYEDNLNAIRQMKELCEENQVEFMVIMAPSFLSETGKCDGPNFWKYMSDIASITEFWDFSGYHAIDLNPYNFYNEGHFYYEIFDLMVDTMAGKDSYEGFGTYVTKENIYEHLEQRKSDYNRLKKEYEETGTVKLGEYDDPSRIH